MTTLPLRKRAMASQRPCSELTIAQAQACWKDIACLSLPSSKLLRKLGFQYMGFATLDWFQGPLTTSRLRLLSSGRAPLPECRCFGGGARVQSFDSRGMIPGSAVIRGSEPCSRCGATKWGSCHEEPHSHFGYMFFHKRKNSSTRSACSFYVITTRERVCGMTASCFASVA